MIARESSRRIVGGLKIRVSVRPRGGTQRCHVDAGGGVDEVGEMCVRACVCCLAVDSHTPRIGVVDE
jgi:hypothetical protein